MSKQPHTSFRIPDNDRTLLSLIATRSGVASMSAVVRMMIRARALELGIIDENGLFTRSGLALRDVVESKEGS